MSCDDFVVRVTNLSKRYEVYAVPRDRLKQFVLPHWQRMTRKSPRQYFREFWAINDVSMEIRKGDAVGIIGRNGSGKSTLLQMICGTLNPSGGSVETNGRIAALLELGSGFNPEFTGRENVYMNASVLGLSNDEISERFEDIAAFADIGGFIDQPVKTYSSGMYVRLAFSVAIHVEPDILVVDEALSVGDIAFRNKCLEAIKRIMARGATVLFVTHDIGTLQLLCSKVYWLEAGAVRACGDPVMIAQEYYANMVGHVPDNQALSAMPVQQETGKSEFTELRLVGGSDGCTYQVGDSLRVGFALLAKENLGPLVFSISIYRADGDWLVGQSSREAGVVWGELDAGRVCRGRVEFAPLSLAPGRVFCGGRGVFGRLRTLLCPDRHGPTLFGARFIPNMG